MDCGGRYNANTDTGRHVPIPISAVADLAGEKAPGAAVEVGEVAVVAKVAWVAMEASVPAAVFNYPLSVSSPTCIGNGI